MEKERKEFIIKDKLFLQEIQTSGKENYKKIFQSGISKNI